MRSPLQEALAEIDRLRSIIDHITGVWVYPASVESGPDAYERRSCWQEGWNAATAEVVMRYAEAMQPGWKPTESDAE